MANARRVRCAHAGVRRVGIQCGDGARHMSRAHMVELLCVLLFVELACVLTRVHARGGASARGRRAWAHRTRRGARADARDEARDERCGRARVRQRD